MAMITKNVPPQYVEAIVDFAGSGGPEDVHLPVTTIDTSLLCDLLSFKTWHH